MTLDPVLTINNLSKAYGHVQALKSLSLNVQKGSIFGILGPNGSGKTTTLGIILSVIQPDHGTYSWFGNPPGKENLKRIGAILEYPNFYPYLSAIENLKIVADIKDIYYDKIKQVLQTVNLSDRGSDAYTSYSLGMKQRLAIASALLNDPEVLVLDEPTNGLDPQGIVEIRELILKVASRGTTIIMASHLLDEVEKVCTHVAVLKAGEMLFSGNVDEIISGTDVIELGADDMNKLHETLGLFPKVKKIIQEELRLIVTMKEAVSGAELNTYLFTKGIVLSHLHVRKKSLEKHFLELMTRTSPTPTSTPPL